MSPLLKISLLLDHMGEGFRLFTSAWENGSSFQYGSSVPKDWLDIFHQSEKLKELASKYILTALFIRMPGDREPSGLGTL